jgi:hypothetical protein
MKTIMLKTESAAASFALTDAPAVFTKSDLPLARREFLKGTAILSGVIAQGTALSLLTPSLTWAAELSVLNEVEGKFLMRLTQVIFPHKKMPEAINAIAVKDLDAAAKDAAVAKDMRDGIAALNKAAGGDWMKAAPAAQAKTVKDNTALPLFQKVRGQCITSLYDNQLAYAHFGYEGEAFNKGGYITRGFNDLKWLPDPPAAASPAPYF